MMNNEKPNEIEPNPAIKQFQEEINAWKKKLISRMEENIIMKNKLGEILKKNYDQNYLETIEEFQNKFLREDEVTDMLRNDVTKFANLSYGQTFKDERVRKSCEKRMEILRNEIVQSENNFCFLMTSFDDFMFEISN